MNGGLISRERSHGLIQYFPLIARVRTRANVNKMLTEKKVRRHESQSQVCEKPKRYPIETRKFGDLESSASTLSLVCMFPIILYRRKVVNAKSDVCYPGEVMARKRTKWFIFQKIMVSVGCR